MFEERFGSDQEKGQEEGSLQETGSEPLGLQFLCRKWELTCLPPWVA
jgi:hypothetical protein